MNKKIKGVYGGAWAKLISGTYQPSRATLQKLGRAMVAAIVAEARHDAAMEGLHERGQPEGLPKSIPFYKSFSYRIVGDSTIEILCSWPYIDQIIQGREPYPMTWLTQDKGVGIVPLVDPLGKVIFRMAPKTAGDAWIHPGFSKHSFLHRGVQKGRLKIADLMREDIQKQLRGQK